MSKLHKSYGFVLALLGFSFYVISDVIISTPIEGMNYLLGLFYTYCLISLVVLPIIVIQDFRSLKVTNFKFYIGRCLSGSIGSISSIYAFANLQLGLAYSLIFLSPIIVTLLSPFLLREAFTRLKLIAILFGFLGVLIVMRPSLEIFSLAVFMAILSAIASSFNVLFIRMWGKSENPLLAIFYVNSTTAITLFVMTYLSGDEFVLLPLGSLFHVFMGGIFSILGFAIVFLGLRHTTAANVGSAQYVQILWAIPLGYFFRSEGIDSVMLTGILIIILSGIVVINADNLRKRNHPIIMARIFARKRIRRNRI